MDSSVPERTTSTFAKALIPASRLSDGFNGLLGCLGDWGGPLLRLGGSEAGDVQVGVISRAVGDCSRGGLPGMFTDVADVRRWITNIT